MIYTVTVNPSVDYVVQLGEFHPGMVNRALNEAVFSGGKGINVAMILQNLGVSNRVLGFLAGFTGDFIEKDLRRRGCRTDFVRLEKGFSRINVKLKRKAAKSTAVALRWIRRRCRHFLRG